MFKPTLLDSKPPMTTNSSYCPVRSNAVAIVSLEAHLKPGQHQLCRFIFPPQGYYFTRLTLRQRPSYSDAYTFVTFKEALTIESISVGRDVKTSRPVKGTFVHMGFRYLVIPGVQIVVKLTNDTDEASDFKLEVEGERS